MAEDRLDEGATSSPRDHLAPYATALCNQVMRALPSDYTDGRFPGIVPIEGRPSVLARLLSPARGYTEVEVAWTGPEQVKIEISLSRKQAIAGRPHEDWAHAGTMQAFVKGDEDPAAAIRELVGKLAKR